MLFEAKVARKAAFISILPHVKNLTQEKFNTEIWVIDEVQKTEDVQKQHLEKAREFVRRHNQKLSELRRNKENK